MLDPIDGTTNYAHGLPIFCASLALEINGVAEVAAIFDPNRQELFTAERGGGAFVNGQRLRRCRLPIRWSTRSWSPASRTTCTSASTKSSGCSARSSVERVRSVDWARRRSTSATLPPGAWMDSGNRISSLGTSPPGVDCRRGRRPSHELEGDGVLVPLG